MEGKEVTDCFRWYSKVKDIDGYGTQDINSSTFYQKEPM